MDTITHGIAGALLGKAFLTGKASGTAEPPTSLGDESASRRQATRVALFAATLGSVFPDFDFIAGPFVRDRFAMLELHRGVTHSFLCLPFFAFLLAAATQVICRKRRIAAPTLRYLTLIYAVGIALHIVLDLITSWGTMIWSPISNTRVAWDLSSIIDFAFTAIVLLPQVAAWAYRRRQGIHRRAAGVWVLFSLGALGVYLLGRALGYPFSAWVVVLASALMAAVFLLPLGRDWGLGISRQSWCRAGVAALALYLGAQAAAHHAALRRVREFAAARNLSVERLGALPMPPSLLYWNGLIRSHDGVYYSRLNLGDSQPANFDFFPDSPGNGYVEAALQLPVVQKYLWFARFPVVSYANHGDLHTVQFGDLRFFSRRTRREPFRLRILFDDGGRVLDYHWITD